MHDSAELNRMLIDRLEELCLHLFPNGSKKGNRWIVGGIEGESGASMEITLSSSAAGRFVDFANRDTKGATPLWLIAKAKAISFVDAIKYAADWLNVKPEDYGIRRHKKKVYEKPGKVDLPPSEPNTKIMDYLTITRGLCPIAVSNAKILEADNGETIVFQYADWNPEANRWDVCHRKFLKLERPDGKKDTWATRGTKRCLYGKQTIDANCSDIVICEGEIDQISWASYGVPAVSIPNGVADIEWVDIDWDWLSRFEKIYVSMDMDDPGQQAAQDICKKLGLHRTYIVALPKKDCNECLTSGVSRDDILKCLASAKAIELDEIKRPDAFRKDVLDHYEVDPGLQGYQTPWYPDLPWRVRPGELTIWSGHGGSGKTQAINQLILSLVSQGLKALDISLEIRPSLTLYYMSRCALAKKYAPKEEVEACIDWLNDSILFLDCIGSTNVDRIINAMVYARRRHSIDLFVIDSLFKCGIAPEDYAAQRTFADKLTSFCNNTGAHVILVAHSRKAQNGNEYTVPTKADISGSSDLGNAAFNVLVSWRNKLKKRKIEEAKFNNDAAAMAEALDQPDGKILLDKQRFGEGEECEIFTWFDRDSCQFGIKKDQVIPYFKMESQ